MFFSVIVTIYNGESFLAPCLDGVLRNPIGNYELIIVDDGSTDDTGKICDSYSDRYDQVRCVHSENLGIGNARQVGLDNASGEYVIFVDGDDVWDESFNLCNLEYEIKKSHADLYVFGYILRRIGQNGYSDSHVSVSASIFEDWRNRQAQFLSCFPNGLMFPCWNKIFKRQLIVENHVTSVNQQMEDFRFVLEFLNVAKKVVFLPGEPYIYMKRENQGLSSSAHDGMLEGYNYCHNLFLSLFDKEHEALIHQIMAPQYIATININLSYLDLHKDERTARKVLRDVHDNALARQSLLHYKPCSFSEKMTMFLMRKGFFTTLREYRQIVSAFKATFIGK